MIGVAVGVCGSGKTYRLQTIVAETLAQTQAHPKRAGWRFLVLDTNHEWPGEPADVVSRAGGALAFVGARTPMDAYRALDQGATAVILRPDPAATAAESKARELADAAAWVAIRHGEKLKASGPVDGIDSGVCLVLPEVHQYAQEGRPLPDNLRIIVHRFRHTNTGLLADTQHFQDVKKEVLRESLFLCFHAQTHPTDLDKLDAYGGCALRLAVEDAARRLAEAKRAGRQADGAGWHVHYDTHMGGPPPFELER